MGTFITGPAAAMYLGDLGADVIKVERPGTGDPFRSFKGGLYSPHYQTYNRNKRAITLDTSKDDDRALFHELIETADVFIQNFRPGVAEKLGAGEAELKALNPRLVYCAISGFGTSGPYRDRPAYDTVAQAASGFLRLVMPPDKPRVIGPAIADAMTGFYAALGVLAALYERQTTGKGRRIDVSMLEAMCHFNLNSFTHYFSEGEIMGPLSRPMVSQSYVFECADKKWLALHMSSPPKFWEGLASVIEGPISSTIRASRRARRASTTRMTLIALMAPIFRKRTRDEWCERARGGGSAALARLRFERGARGSAGEASAAQGFRRASRDGHLHHGPQSRSPSTASCRSTCCRRRRSASTTKKIARELAQAPA